MFKESQLSERLMLVLCNSAVTALGSLVPQGTSLVKAAMPSAHLLGLTVITLTEYRNVPMCL